MLNKIKQWFTGGTNAVASGVQKTAFSTKAVLTSIKNKVTTMPEGYKKPEMTWNEQNELVVQSKPEKKKKGRPSKKNANKETSEPKATEEKKN